MFDWEDLRAYLAAVEGGSFTAAAHKLSVNPATIGRRTARLESALRATLLVRSPGGLHPTTTGARVFEEGRRAEAAMLAAHQAAQPDLVGGVVRLSVSEAFGTVILAPALPAFRKARPGIRIELAASAGFLSPSRYEVDLAVTLSAPDNPRLHVEPLAEYGLGLFASHTYLADHAAPAKVEDLHDHDIVGYVDDLIYTPELRYLDEVRPGLSPAISSSSIRAQQAIIAAGGGIGVLPRFMAADLTPVLADSVRLKRRFWVSTRLEVKDISRIRLVRAWLSAVAHTRLNSKDGASHPRK